MKKKRIMIIEDELIVADDIKMSAEKLGYDVCGMAVSGEEAIKKAEKLNPDLVLMDIILEGEMDGIKAASIIRSRFGIPFVYLTAYADDKTLERAKKTGPFGYIIKPFEDRELHSTIEIALYKHKLERRLIDSEGKYRTLTENVNVGVSRSTPDSKGEFIEANPTIIKMFGYESKKEFLKQNVVDLYQNPGDRIKFHEKISKNGFVKNEELYLKKKDGTPFIASVSAVAVKDKNGELRYYDGIIEDISKRKEMEKELETSRASFFNIVKNSADGIIIVDKKGIVRFFNPTAEILFGRKATEFIGQIFGYPAVVNESTEIDIIHSGGEARVGEMRVVETDWENEPAYLVSIREITERKKAEKEIREARDKAERALKELRKVQAHLIQQERVAAVGELSAGIAHEINNPLNIISGNTQIMLMDENLDSEVKNTMEIIKEQVERAARITDQLLHFSKRAQPDIKEIDVNEAVNSTLTLLKHRLNLDKIKRVKKLPAGPVYISADPAQLQQVFLNLVINASQAMPNGGTITISSKMRNSNVEINFTDTGCGIPEENLSKLFEPFFTTKEKGAGLGLSIVYGIIEAHNGNIKVKSKVGEGTTFTITLPAKEKALK